MINEDDDDNDDDDDDDDDVKAESGNSERDTGRGCHDACSTERRTRRDEDILRRADG